MIYDDTMQPPNRHLRVNVSELKAQLLKRLGPGKSEQYFDCLNRLLSLRLSKFEFDKLCLKLLGKENLPLHNQLIRAVLQNVCRAKAPPPVSVQHKVACFATDNGPLSLVKNSATSLGLNGEGNLVSLSRNSVYKISNGVFDNGTLQSSDQQKLLQHHQELIEDGFSSGYNKERTGAAITEEEYNLYKFSRSQLQAPSGTLFRPVSARRRCSSSYDSGGLFDTSSLRERMQHIAADQGLEGVTMDCASLLNLGLNSYLKTLIGSCAKLARARSVGQFTNKILQQDTLQQKRVHSGIFLQEERWRVPITVLDLKAAMEPRPQQLGEEWPSLLEKISVHDMKG